MRRPNDEREKFSSPLYHFFCHALTAHNELVRVAKRRSEKKNVERCNERRDVKIFIIQPHNLHLSRRWCNFIFILLHQRAQLAELNDSYIHLNFISHSSSSVISKTSNLSLSHSHCFRGLLEKCHRCAVDISDKPPHELHFFLE